MNWKFWKKKEKKPKFESPFIYPQIESFSDMRELFDSNEEIIKNINEQLKEK